MSWNKAIKGWLQSQDKPFPKTHDIEDLVAHAARPPAVRGAELSPAEGGLSSTRLPDGHHDRVQGRSNV